MQVTFRASPELLKVGEIGESIVEADESLRKQLVGFVLTAVYDRNIPLRTHNGFKLSERTMDRRERHARQVAKNETKKELVAFETRIRQAITEQAEQRTAREAGIQAIARQPIVKPESFMQSPLWREMYEEQANRLAGGEAEYAELLVKERYRPFFVLASEVVDWLRKEHGFVVTVVESSILVDDEPPISNAGVVSVTLPHMPARLAAVFEIMRRNWADYDPRRPPKQVNVAREIGKALGWREQADGSPSRDAKTIAMLIKPDATDDTK